MIELLVPWLRDPNCPMSRREKVISELESPERVGLPIRFEIPLNAVSREEEL